MDGLDEIFANPGSIGNGMFYRRTIHDIVFNSLIQGFFFFSIDCFLRVLPSLQMDF